MALKNRKIRLKHRGTRTNGQGKKGSRRKASGKGNAGAWKHKRIWFVKNDPDHFGRKGMTVNRTENKYVSLSWINDYAKTNELKEIDITKFGYTRVLGSGEITVPVTVRAKSFTSKAKEKIEASGGVAKEI